MLLSVLGFWVFFGVQYLVAPLSKISIFLGPPPFPIFHFHLCLKFEFFLLDPWIFPVKFSTFRLSTRYVTVKSLFFSIYFSIWVLLPPVIIFFPLLLLFWKWRRMLDLVVPFGEKCLVLRVQEEKCFSSVGKDSCLIEKCVWLWKQTFRLMFYFGDLAFLLHYFGSYLTNLKLEILSLFKVVGS